MLREGRAAATLITLAVVLLASVSFAGLTILLYQAGHLELHGSPLLQIGRLILAGRTSQNIPRAPVG